VKCNLRIQITFACTYMCSVYFIAIHPSRNNCCEYCHTRSTHLPWLGRITSVQVLGHDRFGRSTDTDTDVDVDVDAYKRLVV
jgi:hypothetical protein